MEETETSGVKPGENNTTATFKKPVLIGKIGRLPRHTSASKSSVSSHVDSDNETKKETSSVSNELKISSTNSTSSASVSNQSAPKEKTSENVVELTLSYEEPEWGGRPISEIDYYLEEMKSGVVVEKRDLMRRSFSTIGRLNTCHIYQAHPTISRYHAVLQYKAVDGPKSKKGFYLYDLDSTHGTFLNKIKIPPRMYVPIEVGHMFRFGHSTRTFLLVGPDNNKDSEEEEITITEMKAKRAEQLRERELQEIRAKEEREQQLKKEEERGVDWGMGEDADEETDLAENPYASTNNEELYVEDPKKALRGFMEREGHELHYEVTERGVGQFLCSVTLPIDDARGRPIVAEALVKGKKKEAVVQCALEACRILDRYGVLRQAMHESKKRKAKNWEENDYYDSDEDTFLDRTGTIERKREKRMKARQQQQPETYQSLCAKETAICEEIKSIEKRLNDIPSTGKKDKNRDGSDADEADSLEQFMSELHSNKPDKYEIGRMKNDLNRLRKEHSDIVKLINIVRPANLPPLLPVTSSLTVGSSGSTDGASTSGIQQQQKKQLPLFGKRLKVQLQLPARAPTTMTETNVSSDSENEEDEEVKTDNKKETSENITEEPVANDSAPADGEKENPTETNVNKCNSEVVTKMLRKIAEEEENIAVEEKRLRAYERKLLEQINRNDNDDSSNERLLKLYRTFNKVTSDICGLSKRKIKIIEQINGMTENISRLFCNEGGGASGSSNSAAMATMTEEIEELYKKLSQIYERLLKLGDIVTLPEVFAELQKCHETFTTEKNQALEALKQLTENENHNRNYSEMLDNIIAFQINADHFFELLCVNMASIRQHLDKDNESLTSTAEPQMQLQEEQEKDDDGDDGIEENSKNDDENKDGDADDNDGGSSGANSRKQKKNLRRIAQRQEKAEHEKKKQYEEDAMKDNYDMWVPPEGQTGDGRTSLNDKLGY